MTTAPIKKLRADLLDVVITGASWAYHPGYLILDEDDENHLVSRGLAEPTIDGDQPYGATARLTRRGWETARHHATTGTRVKRVKGSVLDEPLYPGLPGYLS